MRRTINWGNVLYVDDYRAYFVDGSVLETDHAMHYQLGCAKAVIPVAGYRLHGYYFDNKFGEEVVISPVVAFNVTDEYATPVTATDGFDLPWSHWVCESPTGEFTQNEQVFKSYDDWLERARLASHKYIVFHDAEGAPEQLGKLMPLKGGHPTQVEAKLFDLSGQPTGDTRKIDITSDEQVSYFCDRDTALAEAQAKKNPD